MTMDTDLGEPFWGNRQALLRLHDAYSVVFAHTDLRVLLGC